MRKIKTKIAAAATVLGLGALAGVALSAGGQKAGSTATKPIVRTKVIRRTTHVVKHARPKHPVAGGGSGGGTTTASSTGSGGGYASATTGSSSTGGYESAPEPVTTATSGAAAEPAAEYTPVSTSTSGTGTATGGGGGESEYEAVGRESERGGDD